MSSVKITRLFREADYRSIEICQPSTPIHKALKEQGLNARPTVARKYFSPTATKAIRRYIKEEQVKAIFVHATRDLWLLRPALIGHPEIKLFVFARMFIKDISKKDPLHTWIYSRINKMITLSQIQQNHLLNCLPLPKDKYVTIPNGVDTERFKPRPRREDIRQSWGIDNDQFLFGLIGRLDLQKGSLEFVEAAAEVIKSAPRARFVMVGGNTIGEAEVDRKIKSRLKELGLTGKVILTDFRKDIPDVMNALDAFVMPSYEENFGNVLLEALASGLPTIGTNSRGTPEILDNGVTGLLCEPRSSQSLQQSMLRLLNEPNLCLELSHQARAKALVDYDMGRVFAKIEALILD